MDFKLFLCVLFLLLNCAIYGHGRSITPRQAEFGADRVVPETVNMDEPEFADTTVIPGADTRQNLEEDAARRQNLESDRINRQHLVTDRVPEVIGHAEIATTMIPQTVERVETVTRMVPETIERSEVLTTRVPETIERVEPVTRTFTDVFERPQVYTTMVPEVVEKSEVLTTRVPEYVTRIEPVTRTYTQIVEHPEIRTTMVPEVITHSEPEFEIVTEIIQHPEIMTTMIPETISRRVPLTTVITELVGEHSEPLTTITSEIVGERIEPQTTITSEIVGERVEPQTEIVSNVVGDRVQPPYVPPQPKYVVGPQIVAGPVLGQNTLGPDATLDEIERNNKLRVAKLVDLYIAQLEAPAKLQAQALANAEAARLQVQQNIANAQRGLVAPAYVPPTAGRPGYPYAAGQTVARPYVVGPVPVGPVVTPATYASLQDQINVNIENAKIAAEANRQKVLADVARIQAENHARLAALHARLGLPAPIAPVSPILPQTSPVVEDPCLRTNTDAYPPPHAVTEPYPTLRPAQETPFQRWKRQSEDNQKKIAADIKAQQDKLKADIESLKQKNDAALQKLLHPITVRPTVQLPVTQDPTVFGAPVTQTLSSLPAKTRPVQPIQDFQQKVNAQIAVDNARAQLPVITPQTVNPTVFLPTTTQFPTIQELQQRLKEQMQENQRKLEQTLQENRLRLEKQQEETKARLASLLPAQPTVIAPLNPVVQTTELPITRRPVATFETTTFATTMKTEFEPTNAQSIADKLKSKIEEQRLKILSNSDRLREDTRQRLNRLNEKLAEPKNFETTTLAKAA